MFLRVRDVNHIGEPKGIMIMFCIRTLIYKHGYTPERKIKKIYIMSVHFQFQLTLRIGFDISQKQFLNL